MKLMHLADLHLGKRVNGFSMLDDQRYILQQIYSIAEAEQPEAILIAGDVYDRPVPPEEAVNLFNDFLVGLMQLKKQVFIISGNHDSAERVSFGGRLMDPSGIHFAPLYNGKISPLQLEDEFGPVYFWLIPFFKPVDVRHFYPDTEIKTFADAMQTVVDSLGVDSSARNVALVHQFITGGEVCESEDNAQVGGIDNIPHQALAPFDYVALGHLHGPQFIGRETVRYSGSPLKYSFSECRHEKGVTIVELGEKGSALVRNVPLKPLYDMVRLTGFFDDFISRCEKCYDYCEITLRDEEDPVNAFARLREVFPNIMLLRYDNTRTKQQQVIDRAANPEQKTLLQLMEELFGYINNTAMTDEQRELIVRLEQQSEEEQA